MQVKNRTESKCRVIHATVTTSVAVALMLLTGSQSFAQGMCAGGGAAAAGGRAGLAPNGGGQFGASGARQAAGLLQVSATAGQIQQARRQAALRAMQQRQLAQLQARRRQEAATRRSANSSQNPRLTGEAALAGRQRMSRRTRFLILGRERLRQKAEEKKVELQQRKEERQQLLAARRRSSRST